MEDINNILLQLEENLRSVQSSRQQVDNVIREANRLESILRQCSGDFSNVCTSVQNLFSFVANHEVDFNAEVEQSLSSLQETCTKIQNSLESETTSIANNFNTNVNRIIDCIKPDVESLKNNVESIRVIEQRFSNSITIINEIKTKLEELCQKLIDSQNAQDGVLLEIKNKITEISSSIEASKTSIESKCSTIVEAQEETNDIVKSLVAKSRTTNILIIILLLLQIITVIKLFF